MNEIQTILNNLNSNLPTILICTLIFFTVSFINASITRDSSSFSSSSSSSLIKPNKGPTPKWEVLRAMNYIVLGVFISSVTYATINYHQTLSQGATPFFIGMVVLWCLCLGYFFGFFGISFIDQETLQRSPSSLGLPEVSHIIFYYYLLLFLLILINFFYYFNFN